MSSIKVVEWREMEDDVMIIRTDKQIANSMSEGVRLY